MAKLRVTGKHYTRNGMLGISLIVVAAVAVVSLIVGFLVLPNYAQVEDYKTPEVIGISMPDDAMISVNADLSSVYAVVRYDNGETKKVPISELIYDGLDVSKEGVCKDVILNYGGFTQKIDFNVVPTQLTVEYVAGAGGRIDGTTNQSIEAGGDADTVRAIADEGYYFARWSDGELEASRTDKQVSKSMKLIAVFEKRSYTVVFYYPDGTTAREESVLYNESPTRAPLESERDMVLYGYKFIGWDTDFTHITQDTNIHPIYEKYAVDFHLDITTDESGAPLGGAGGGTDILDYYQKEVEAEIRIEANPERIFTGWYVRNADGNWVFIEPSTGTSKKIITVGTGVDVWFASAPVPDTENYVLTFTPPKEGVDDLYVKAHFVFEESKIRFTSALGSVNVTGTSDEVTLEYGTPVGTVFDVEDLTKVAAKGYTFKGWYIENGSTDSDGKPVFIKNTATFEQDTTIVAYWEKNVNTVVFLKGDNEDTTYTDPAAGYDADLGGRVVKVRYMEKISDSVEYAYPEVVPYKENHTFKGWFLADEYGTATSTSVDRSFVVENDVVYVVPVFEVNTKRLTVSVTGSGGVYQLVSYTEANGTVYQREVPVSAITYMPVTETFTLRFRPGSGYTLVSVTVNGSKTTGMLAKEGDFYDYEIKPVITTDYDISAEFSLDVHEVSIANGSLSQSGRVLYNAIGAPDSTKDSTTETNTTLNVNHGSGLYIEIEPPKKNRIAKVSVNGVELKDIPADAVYYAFAIENCTANVSVTIGYEAIKYSVTLPVISDGEMIADTTSSDSTYTMGDSPSFTVKANEGYYIKALRANGAVIDPYAKREGYEVANIKVNGSAISPATTGDYRITEMRLSVDGIKCDTAFTVEYAPLYYKITTSYTGVGNVSKSSTVGYGAPVTVQAETSDGYYVSSYIVDSLAVNDSEGNPLEYKYTDRGTSKAYYIGSVKNDYDIKFVFVKTTYHATFRGEDRNVSVTYGTRTENASGATFGGIESGSNATFVIEADEGYRLSSVTVKAIGADVTENVPIGYDTTSYTLTVNNISDSYEVVVSATAIRIDYTVYFLNPTGAQEKKINNADVVDNVVSGTAVYGQNFSVTVLLASNYTLDLNACTVKSKDLSDTYGYTSFVGDYVANDAYGQYTIVLAGETGDDGYTLDVYGVKTSIDVYVYLTPAPGSSAETHNVTLESHGQGTLTSDIAGTTVTDGGDVTFTAVPKAGYSLEALVVNGEVVATDINGKYTVTGVDSDVYVYAIFGETTYFVHSEVTSNGVISLEKTLVTAGEQINIKLTPATGYKASSFSVNIGSRTVLLNNAIENTEGVIEYTLGGHGHSVDEKVDGDVTVKATFEALSYNYSVTFNQGGTVTGLGETGESVQYYGTNLVLTISAQDGYYVSAIKVNGDSYDPSALSKPQWYLDGSNNVKNGELSLFVSEDTVIEVTFLPKVYNVTVSESLGGTTLARKESGAFVSASELVLSAGDKVDVKLRADTGYHIAGVEVNGVENTSWAAHGVNANAISEAVITVSTYVSSNLTVRVIYALNEYQIKVNVSNKSLNFATYDADPSSYGTVTVTGYTADSDNVYKGISHGSNVKLVFAPRTGKGYYVSRFDIVYVDPDTGSQVSSSCLGRINADGGSYIINELAYDISAVNVEFKRRTYSYSPQVNVVSYDSPLVCEGEVATTVSFANPYSASAEVLLDSGKYEYGLTYRIAVDPKTGYERTAFTINGEDRSSAVRSSHYYNGTVTSDIAMAVTYTIKVYKVKMSGNFGGAVEIAKTTGEPIWNNGTLVTGTYNTSDGVIWAGTYITADGKTDEESIIVTHGTTLRFVASPVSAEGYKITSFYINGLAHAITNEDVPMSVSLAVSEETTVSAAFELHVYKISVVNFVGGTARTDTTSVPFDGSATLTLSLNKGYVLKEVYINGDPGADALSAFLGGASTYTLRAIRRDIEFRFDVETKQYNLTFAGDYNATKVINREDGEYTFTAVSGVIVNRNVISKTEWSAFTNEEGAYEDTGRLVNGIRFGDSLIISLTAPNGYNISAVTISADDDGVGQTDLVMSVNGLAPDNGSGTRTYTLSSVPGNVRVSVTYAIKQYTVAYEQRTGGNYAQMITRFSHHELITLGMVSENGYYLSSLNINGREIPTTYQKNEMFYSYSTDIAGTKLEVNDELVNGMDRLVVTATYEKQYYNVLFYVNSRPITGGFTDENLGVTLANNRIVYDEVGTDIALALANGYSLASIIAYSVPIAQSTADNASTTKFELTEATDVAEFNEFTAKATSVKLKLDEKLLGILDFHSTAKNTLRIYFKYDHDTYSSEIGSFLVTADSGTNMGGVISSVDKVSVTATYSDSQTGASHVYGTTATYTATVSASYSDEYTFEGFQEKVGDVWSYVNESTPGVRLTSGGRVLSYTIESDRTFRAVFFRVYTITLEVHPEYKYTRGSFANGDPNAMLYRRYAIMSATATYTANTERNVVFPNIAGNYESLSDTDGNSEDGTYTFKVRSGATVVFAYTDLYRSTNPTNGCSYDSISYDSKGSLIRNEVNFATGVTITKDLDVRAYLKNSVYISFLMETVGSLTANEGGTVSYRVNNVLVNSLKENSLTVSPHDTLVIDIKPRANFRFDSVMELIPMSVPDSSGYRKYNTSYTPLVDSADGSVTIKYYAPNDPNYETPLDISTYDGEIGTVRVTLSCIEENSVFKIRFWKRITLDYGVEFVTDETATSWTPQFELDYSTYGDNATSPKGKYDFGDTVHFVFKDGIAISDWYRYYQFVGYFVNGVNTYTQLSQNYPSNDQYSNYEQSFTLDDLNGLADGVNIEERTTSSGTEYVVKVVARFIPVYNVVLENEYLDSGNYLDPGQTTISTVMYDSSLPVYYVNAATAAPRMAAGDENGTDVSFTMLGKLNSVEAGSKDSASAPYNVWNDNYITLNWSSTAGSGFKFVAWQYYAYNNGTFEWRNIPYSDPLSQTNLVTKPTFTFPVSALFSTSYMAHVQSDGMVDDSFMFNASVYDENGIRVSSRSIPAIRIRPLYQKVEKLTLVQSVATERADIFNDGLGDVEPRIAGTGLSSGEFDYATVQTLLPSASAEYQFAGWYITENGAGGIQKLDVTASRTDYDKVVTVDGVAFYFKAVSIPDSSGNDTGEYLYCSYDNSTGELKVWMDGSYKIFARYTSVYSMNIMVSNSSGYSKLLAETLPTITIYDSKGKILKDSEGNEYKGQRSYSLTNIPVGTQYTVKLETGFRDELNDATYFNPVFDRWDGVTAVNANGVSVWSAIENTSGTVIPEFDAVDIKDIESVRHYNSDIESVAIVVGATDNINLTMRFRTYGKIVLHNVYYGSSIQLPQALAEALYGDRFDYLPTNKYYIADGDEDSDFDKTKNGTIEIANIPIVQGESYDGVIAGDYANRLTSSIGAISNGRYKLGINFNGAEVSSKVQHVVYYGTYGYTVYEWVTDAESGTSTLTGTNKTVSSAYDYPFADGGNSNAGYGTEGAPFKIATVEHLRNLNNLYIGNSMSLANNGKPFYFKQIADIDLGVDGDKLTIALCSDGNGFNGVYDGDGYALYNFVLSSSAGNIGLFAKTFQAEVKNIYLGTTRVESSSAENVGALIGYAEKSTIKAIVFTDKGVANKSVKGTNNVGALVGQAVDCTISGIVVSGYTVNASEGATYSSSGYYIGGAGGIVGLLAGASRLSSSSATDVTIISPYGAGGLVGTVTGVSNSTNESIVNCDAQNANLSSSSILGAAGGVVGSVGIGVKVRNSKHTISRNVTASSQSAYGRFVPDSSNFYKYGVGGVAGYNAGIIDGCSLVSLAVANRLTLKGTIAGGVVGVNVGTVQNSSLSARIYMSRTRATTYEGGLYGGIVGYNKATVTDSFIGLDTVVSNDYNADNAIMEVVTLDKGGSKSYVPTSGTNSEIYEMLGYDNSNLCVGGIVGYNDGGSVKGALSANSKIMVNRRASVQEANETYIGGLAGYSTNNSLSGATASSATLYLKFVHYMYVDITGTAMAAKLGMGSAAGQVDKAVANVTVNGTAEYIGGGTDYNEVTKEAFKWGTKYASGYKSGSANVTFKRSGGSFSASSYVSRDWNEEGAISDASGEAGKAYANTTDCDKYTTALSTATLWNYRGTLRYVAITVS